MRNKCTRETLITLFILLYFIIAGNINAQELLKTQEIFYPALQQSLDVFVPIDTNITTLSTTSPSAYNPTPISTFTQAPTPQPIPIPTPFPTPTSIPTSKPIITPIPTIPSTYVPIITPRPTAYITPSPTSSPTETATKSSDIEVVLAATSSKDKGLFLSNKVANDFYHMLSIVFASTIMSVMLLKRVVKIKKRKLYFAKSLTIRKTRRYKNKEVKKSILKQKNIIFSFPGIADIYELYCDAKDVWDAREEND